MREGGVFDDGDSEWDVEDGRLLFHLTHTLKSLKSLVCGNKTNMVANKYGERSEGFWG